MHKLSLSINSSVIRIRKDDSSKAANDEEDQLPTPGPDSESDSKISDFYSFDEPIPRMLTPPSAASPPLSRGQNYKVNLQNRINVLKNDLAREQAHSAKLSEANSRALFYIQHLTTENEELIASQGRIGELKAEIRKLKADLQAEKAKNEAKTAQDELEKQEKANLTASSINAAEGSQDPHRNSRPEAGNTAIAESAHPEDGGVAGLEEMLLWSELGFHKLILFAFGFSLLIYQTSPMERANWPAEDQIEVDKICAKLVSFSLAVRVAHASVKFLNGLPPISITPNYSELRGHRAFTCIFFASLYLSYSMDLWITEDGKFSEELLDLITVTLTLRTTYVLLSCIEEMIQFLEKVLKKKNVKSSSDVKAA